MPVAGCLKNALIPDGNGGHIHLQYALLTRRGILILDIKDVEGHVFGSEGMQDWTVLANDRRYTFANPQPGLWDRLAAVKRLTPEVPVTGYVAFGAKARFSKGQPRSVDHAGGPAAGAGAGVTGRPVNGCRKFPAVLGATVRGGRFRARGRQLAGSSSLNRRSALPELAAATASTDSRMHSATTRCTSVRWAGSLRRVRGFGLSVRGSR